jgi:polar amino acid transport system permease protein
MNQFIAVFIENFETLCRAALITVKLTSVSLFISIFIGMIVCYLSLVKNRFSNGLASAYLAIIRGLPLIVQLMFLYFGISKVLALPAFWAGSIALAIHAGAYVSEIFRGAIVSIDVGQWEAAKALGLNPFQALRYVVAPQAFKRCIAPLGNQFIIGLKDSSLVAYLGINELFGEALSIQAENYLPFETYLVAGIYYLILVVFFSYLVKKLEQRLAVRAG